MEMRTNSIDKQINDIFAKMDFANHPLAVKIQKGELSKEQVKGWAKQWYHGFLGDADRWVAEAFVKCPVESMRRALIWNACEEAMGVESKTDGHPVLFRGFVKELGISHEELAAEPLTPEAWASTLNFWTIREIPWYQFGALFLTSESQIPLAYVKIMDGLKKHYGVSDEGNTFFRIHAAEVDEEHTATNLKVIREYVTSERDREECIAIVKRTAGLIDSLMNVYQKY